MTRTLLPIPRWCEGKHAPSTSVCAEHNALRKTSRFPNGSIRPRIRSMEPYPRKRCRLNTPIRRYRGVWNCMGRSFRRDNPSEGGVSSIRQIRQSCKSCQKIRHRIYESERYAFEVPQPLPPHRSAPADFWLSSQSFLLHFLKSRAVIKKKCEICLHAMFRPGSENVSVRITLKRKNCLEAMDSAIMRLKEGGQTDYLD